LIRDTILALENLLMNPKGPICDEDRCTIQQILNNLCTSHGIGTVTCYPIQFFSPYNLPNDRVYVIKK
jgi:hypothetical protein